jgi:hypothetical protein
MRQKVHTGAWVLLLRGDSLTCWRGYHSAQGDEARGGVGVLGKDLGEGPEPGLGTVYHPA